MTTFYTYPEPRPARLEIAPFRQHAMHAHHVAGGDSAPAGPQPRNLLVRTDSLTEREGFDGDLGRQVPALIAVFELAGTAMALQRGTKVVRPDRHPEFR